MITRIHTTFALVFLLLLSPAAEAQTTGTISGAVTDTQGLAVPGVTITVAGTQGARSAVSDGAGRFQVPFLVPGSYDVRAEIQGFRMVEIRGVLVSLGQTSELSIPMAPGDLTETVEVTGDTVIVDTTSTTIGAVLTNEQLRRVPVGRRFSDTIYLASGVVSGGSVGRANPSIAGGTGLDNQYIIDGVNVTNQGYGALGSYSIVFGSLGSAIPFDFIKEVQVKTGGYEAEYGQAVGGVVNVVTKSGSNAFRATAFAYARPGFLQGSPRTYESLNGTVQFGKNNQTDAGFEAGSPLIPNRLFVFAALNPSLDTRRLRAPAGFPLEPLGFVDRQRRSLNYATKVTYQLSTSHRLDMSVFGDPSSGEMGPQRATALQVTDVSSFSELSAFGGHNQTLRYDGVITPSFLLEGSLGHARNTIKEIPSVDEWRVVDQTVVPNVTTGGVGFYEQGNDSRNLQFTAKATNLLGGHQIQYGLQYDDVAFAQSNQRTGPSFIAPDGRTTATGAEMSIVPDAVFGRIYRVTRANFNAARTTDQHYVNLFIQDSWAASDRLTVNPGLRFERQTLSGTIVDDFTLTNNWAPRIGVIYDVLGTGRSKLYANYGRFYARMPNDLAARALSADDAVSRADYFDAALTRPVPNGVVTQIPGSGAITNHFVLAGVGADEIDPDAKLSYKDEFVLGYEWEAFENVNLGVRYIHRGLRRVLEDVAAAPLVAYDLGLVSSGAVAYVLTNPGSGTPTLIPELAARFEDPKHRYDAVEISLERALSPRWSAATSYRWSRLHGTFEGFYRDDNGQSAPGITSLYDFPTDDPSYTGIGTPRFGYQGDIRYLGALGQGPLPLDRPHALRAYGHFAPSEALAFGAVVNATSGRPLTALASNPNYSNGGEIPLTPRGAGIHTVDGFRTRTPFEFQLDVQASYVIRVAGRRLTLLADAFNVFNLRRVQGYDAWTELGLGVPNPDFGKPVSQLTEGPAFQAPFALRIGARFEF